MNIDETILYTKDNTGAMREWAISCSDEIITIRYGQVGGSMQYQYEQIERGKATRTIDEQVMSRMASRISKQRDKGYVLNYMEARINETTNTLGLPKPMLAKKLRDVKNIDFSNAIVQPKFDGNRCMIYCENGVNKAYSRNGKPVEAISHILADIDIPERTILDGELYCHGYPLQTIVSWIKRKQLNTLKLKYHVYDTVSAEPYKRRSELIRAIPHGSSIVPVYGESCGSTVELNDSFRIYRAEGYEGAILRWGKAGYEDGKRSKYLVKVKHWEDAEFCVIDIIESKDGWAILICAIEGGATFRVSAPGTVAEKTEILCNYEYYIGKMVTVEYANLTKDGIPFHPIAKSFRDDIQ